MTTLAHRPFHAAARVPVLTSDEMRAWDRRSQQAGIAERVLMEAAGRAAAAVLASLFPEGRVVAAVGGGNNGGDALVLLRTLKAWGREVEAVYVGSSRPDAALLHGWEVRERPGEEAEAAFRDAAVVVDGILGTGGKAAPRQVQAAAIEAMERAGTPVLALDGPSGVDLTDGSAPGAAVRAAVTVTFGAPKRGLLLFPGRERAGRIVVVDVPFVPLEDEELGARLITGRWVRETLPRLPANVHKGRMGTVSVVAGHPGMAGAAILAGMGAGRGGAGKIRLVSHIDNRVILQPAVPEALFQDRAAPGLGDDLEDSQAVVAGPGMGNDEEALAVLRTVLTRGEAPVLLDADALTMLAADPSLRDLCDRPILLTPHPGEMGRLLGRDTKEITADPFATVAEAAERFGCAVLLKGSPSLAAAPGETTLVNVAGHSGIATGGMGDVLAGVAGAAMAVGCSPRDAAGVALWTAGRAAEIAGRGRGLLPRDVLDALPAALAETGEDEAPAPVPGILLDLPPAR